MGGSASPQAAAAVPGVFTLCLEEVGIGGEGLRFFTGSIFGIVVFFHSSLIFGHEKVMCMKVSFFLLCDFSHILLYWH